MWPRTVASVTVFIALLTPEAVASSADGRFASPLPIVFEKNQGQAHSSVRYIARSIAPKALLTDSGPVLLIPGSRNSLQRVHLRFAGSSAHSTFEAAELAPTRIHYYFGRDPSGWRTNLPTWQRVMQREVYPGVDVVYQSSHGNLRYDFSVAPGARTDQIRLAVDGADEVAVDGDGTLRIRAGGAEIRQMPPRVFQGASPAEELPSRYRILPDGLIGISIDGRNPLLSLLIDPTLVYATYYGSSFGDSLTKAKATAAGNLFLAGSSYGTDFPPNPVSPTSTGQRLVVAKLAPQGNSVAYLALIGGSSGIETAYGLDVDSSGNAFVTGTTRSADFPVTTGSLRTAFDPKGTDQFLFKLNSNGTSMVYSTFIGPVGCDPFPQALRVDGVGSAFLSGTHNCGAAWPRTGLALELNGSIFITKVNSTGSALLYQNDLAAGTGVSSLDIDGAGNVYLGLTAFGSLGIGSASVVKVNPTAGTIAYRTSLGQFAWPDDLVVDPSGNNLYVVGSARGLPFPVTAGAYRPAPEGFDLFYAKLASAGTPAVVTFIGGPANEGSARIAVDSSGVYVAGTTGGPGLATTSDAHRNTYGGGSADAFLVKIREAGTAVEYATFVGGSGDDFSPSLSTNGSGGIFLAMQTGSPGLATTPTAVQPTQPSQNFAAGDFYAARFDFGSSFGVTSISPKTGGDGGLVTVQIIGDGMAPGSTVTLLRGGSTVVGTRVSSSFAGQVLAATFDLTGKARGLWDVVVTNPSGQSITLPSAFTVEAVTPPLIETEVIGPSFVRRGVPARFVVRYTNRGNVNREKVPVWIDIPSSADFKPVSRLQSPKRPTVPDWDQVSPVSKDGTKAKVPLLIPSLNAGSSGEFAFDLTFTATEPQAVRSYATTPLTDSNGSQLGPAWSACGVGFAQFATSLTGTLVGFIPGVTCITDIGFAFRSTFLNIIDLDINVAQNDPASLQKFALAALLDAAQATLACAADVNPALKVISVATSVVGTALTGLATVNQCDQAAALTIAAFNELKLTVVESRDPNDKSGPPGTGAQRYISASESLSYLIQFENIATATAPAQDVVITDQLDPNTMDLSTYSLSFVSFGDKFVSAVPGKPSFSTDVDLRPSRNLIARITVDLNTTTGLLTARIRSIDPATNQPTTDPLAGFLPPNVTPPQGQGSLFFTVKQKAGLSSGTRIANRASIVFDTNAAILTPEWANTIDTSRPTSRVNTLSATQSTASFPVSWQGSDTGSGIQTFAIYVSANGGQFSPWLIDTTQTQGQFVGQFGHTYAFYSIARDLTGNVENAKTAAEATTRVGTDSTPPVITPTISGTLGTNGWYRSNVTVNWSVIDPESGIASSTGCSATVLTNDTQGTTLTCSATNGAGLPRSVSVTVKIDKTTPVISGMPATDCTLWPPNHNLVQVATVRSTDAISGMAAFSVTGISNEPENGTGDGDTAPDIVVTGSGVGPRSIQLRAERAGTGTGRIYTLTATANDQAGNSATARATCSVPVNQDQ